MVTDLGDSVFIEFEADEFQLANWSKFRQLTNSPVQGRYAQTATTGHAPTFTVGTDSGDVVVTRVQGRVALNRPQCWVVTSRQSAQLLQHEQGHYYITYIGYVLMLQAIRALRIPVSQVHIPRGASAQGRQVAQRNAITRRVQGLLTSTSQRANQLTADYDAPQPPGTNHGANTSAQQAWNQRFAVSLTQGTPL